MLDRTVREELQAGDSVIFVENGGIALRKVIRTTATRVFIDDGEGFRKDTGERWGWKCTAGWHTPPHILPVTEGRMKMVRADFLKKTAVGLANEVIATVKGHNGVPSNEWLEHAVSQMRGIKKPE